MIHRQTEIPYEIVRCFVDYHYSLFTSTCSLLRNRIWHTSSHQSGATLRWVCACLCINDNRDFTIVVLQILFININLYRIVVTVASIVVLKLKLFFPEPKTINSGKVIIL